MLLSHTLLAYVFHIIQQYKFECSVAIHEVTQLPMTRIAGCSGMNKFSFMQCSLLQNILVTSVADKGMATKENKGECW